MTLHRAVILSMSLLTALPACSQYPGQVTKSGTDAPELRSIAVLEWTGEAGKPKSSRLVPVALLDGGQLQDGAIYMARPEPLALGREVEYELQQNGKPIGFYDLMNAAHEQGSWVGYGAWKPLAAPRPKPSMQELARSMGDDEESDQPVLHRKHHADEGSAGAGNTGSSGTASTSTAPPLPSDPDRPTLHKRDSSDSTTGSGAPTNDPDRPVLKKSRQKPPEEIGHVDSLPGVTDPDRPLLKRGKSSGDGLDLVPTLMGMPLEMQQAVAVSDAKSPREHIWTFNWADPDDEAKMKSALEEIARNALGLNPTPAPAPRKTARKNPRPAPRIEAPPPPPLLDERFRVFELAYGSGATLVFSARTDAPLRQQKFVTLIAQPDLYGNVLVLLKNLADSAHLDETPHMRLVDAVDALGDNRGELLFELRGATQRQFALYRILRGQAEKLFVTGSSEYGTGTKQ